MAKETVKGLLIEIRDMFKASLKVPLPAPTVRSADGRFVRNSDGTVTDNLLKLIWYPTLPEKKNWEGAKKACTDIGCRLPTTAELFSLVDRSKYDPAIDKDIFPDTKTNDWYWTADPCAWGSGYAWIVNFGYGYVLDVSKGSDYYVRPVRSSQS